MKRRSRSALQPNVAAQRLRWVEESTNHTNRKAVASVPGSMSGFTSTRDNQARNDLTSHCNMLLSLPSFERFIGVIATAKRFVQKHLEVSHAPVSLCRLHSSRLFDQESRTILAGSGSARKIALRTWRNIKDARLRSDPDRRRRRSHSHARAFWSHHHSS